MLIEPRRTLVWATAAAALAGALLLTASDSAAWHLGTPDAAATRPHTGAAPMPSSVGRSTPAAAPTP